MKFSEFIRPLADKKIGCSNLFRTAIRGNGDLRMFDTICKYDVTRAYKQVFETTLQYDMVWYRKNNKGQAGWNSLGSKAYTFEEYLDKFPLSADKSVEKIYNSIKNRLRKPADVIVAWNEDGQLGGNRIVVDGTHRLLAFGYLQRLEPEIFNRRLNESKHGLKIITLYSPYMYRIFPADFLNAIFI